MKKSDVVCLLIGIAVGAGLWAALSPLAFPAAVTPVFSPGGGERIIALIDSARGTLDVEIYLLTSDGALEALERANARGVAVRVILEREVMDGGNAPAYARLASGGIPVRYASRSYRLTHSKFMVVDGREVLVGSHNLSGAALYDNREASVIIRDSATVAAFTSVFERDWAAAS